MSFGSSCPPPLLSHHVTSVVSTSLIPLIYPIETFQMLLLRIRLRIFETDVYRHTYTALPTKSPIHPGGPPWSHKPAWSICPGCLQQVVFEQNCFFLWRHLDGYQQKQEITRVFTPRCSRHSCSLPNVRLHVTPTASFGTCHKCRGGRSSPDCTEAGIHPYTCEQQVSRFNLQFWSNEGEMIGIGPCSETRTLEKLWHIPWGLEAKENSGKAIKNDKER